MTLFKGADKGVVVRTIEADAPASRSDLRPFDVITQVDGAAGQYRHGASA